MSLPVVITLPPKVSSPEVASETAMEVTILKAPQLPSFAEGPLATREVAEMLALLAVTPHAFDTWQQLVEAVESSGSTSDMRAVYAAFLDEFPLCWGFWKRYADILVQESGFKAGLCLYEDAVESGAGACVELWINFCDTAVEAVSSDEAFSIDDARDLFDRAVGAVGLDWHSGPLWEAYLDFEESNEDWNRVGALYLRVFSVPLGALDKIHVRFRALMVSDSAPPVEEMFPKAQYSTLYLRSHTSDEHAEKAEKTTSASEMSTTEHDDTAEQPTSKSVMATTEQMPPREVTRRSSPEADRQLESEDGELAEPTHDSGVSEKAPADLDLEDGELLSRTEDSDLEEGEIPGSFELPLELKRVISEANKPRKAPRVGTWTSKWDDEKKVVDTWSLDVQKQQVLESVKKLCGGTLKVAAELKQFEIELKRPYFHEKILNNVQLDIWWRYLDFEDVRLPRSAERQQKLYERCLVATNNYLEFWLRYAAIFEANGNVIGACSLLERACLSGRLRGRADALMAWAEFEEICGEISRARKIYEGALTLSGNAPFVKNGNSKTCFSGSLIEVVLRFSSFEVRHGYLSSAQHLLSQHATATTELLAKGLLTRRASQICEDVLLDYNAVKEVFESAWKTGCKEVSIVASFASLLMRHASEQNRTKEARELALASASSLFEDALVFAQTANATREIVSLWTHYIDFLLLHGAPLMQLSDVQARARSFESLRCFGASTDIRPKRHPLLAPNTLEHGVHYPTVVE